LAQDCLTTLIQLDLAGTSAEVTKSMVDLRPAAEDKAPLVTQMADLLIAGFFRKVQADVITPHVAAVPGTSAADFLVLIKRRFSNPAIVDTTRRGAFDGSFRRIGFVLPTVRAALTVGAAVLGLTLVEAQ